MVLVKQLKINVNRSVRCGGLTHDFGQRFALALYLAGIDTFNHYPDQRLSTRRAQYNATVTAEISFCSGDRFLYPAVAIGFQTALFAGDGRSLRLRTDDSRCADLKPDLVLTDLEQLIQYI